MSNEQCIHHWVIDEFNVGRCIKCPAVRDFGALMKREVADIVQPARERGGKRGRKSKRQLLVGAMIRDAERNDNGNE